MRQGKLRSYGLDIWNGTEDGRKRRLVHDLYLQYMSYECKSTRMEAEEGIASCLLQGDHLLSLDIRVG